MIGCDAGVPPRAEALDGIRVEPAAGSASTKAVLEAAGAYAAIGRTTPLRATKSKTSKAGPVL